MIKKLFATLFLLFNLILLAGCQTTYNKIGRKYFLSKDLPKGVLPYDKQLELFNEGNDVRPNIYSFGKQNNYYLQCILLRNQLYTAINEGGLYNLKKEILALGQALEKAYQEDDKSFLNSCNEILFTVLGKEFLSVQENFVQYN